VKQEAPHERRLPVQRAFVVQLAATADVAQGRLADEGVPPGRTPGRQGADRDNFSDHHRAEARGAAGPCRAYSVRPSGHLPGSVPRLYGARAGVARVLRISLATLDAEKGGQHCRNADPGQSEMRFPCNRQPHRGRRRSLRKDLIHVESIFPRRQ
jgi:hypothetical protein